jgi:hypothetical protein
MEKIIGTDLVRNKEVIYRVKKERNILRKIKRRKADILEIVFRTHN